MDTVFDLAEQIGFSHYAPLNVATLEFLPEVRAMCSADRCKSYGRSWSCPPAVGELDIITNRAKKYTGGIIVQTTGTMEDEFDLEAIKNVQVEHKAKFETLVRQVKRLTPSCMPMASGTCTRCKKCTYPDRPCRYPGKVYPSMEAYGLLVRDIREKNGLKYYYGKNTITYTACILI